MSILYPMPDEVIRDAFVYKAKLLGIVPIYLGDLRCHAPNLCERNGCPEWVLTAALHWCHAVDKVAARFGFKVEEGLPLKVDSRIDGKPLAEDVTYQGTQGEDQGEGK